MRRLPISRRLRNVVNRHMFVKNLSETGAGVGSLAGKVVVSSLVTFIVLGIYLSFNSIQESGRVQKLFEVKREISTNVFTLSEKDSGPLWQGYNPNQGVASAVDVQDINMATAAIAITYGIPTPTQLEYLTDYLRSAEQAGKGNKVPPWLIVGLHSSNKDEVQVSSGMYIPHPGLGPADWGKDVNGVLADFHNQTTPMIEQWYSGYTSQTALRSGQHGVLQDTYEQNFRVKGTSNDAYGLYNATHTTAELIAKNYNSFDRMMSWYETGRDNTAKEDLSLKTFQNWSDESKWVFAGLMLAEGNPSDIFEGIPVDQLDTFGRQLDALKNDRSFFDSYLAKVYGHTPYSTDLNIRNGLEEVLVYFTDTLGWKISEQTIKDLKVSRDSFKGTSISDVNNSVYPASTTGEDVQNWGKRNSLYGLAGGRGTAGRHFLEEHIYFPGNDGEVLMALNVDTVMRLMRIYYQGKYYSGVGQYVVNQENAKLRRTGNIVSGGVQVPVRPGQDTGVMYYREFNLWKEAGDGAITDERLIYAINSYQNKMIPANKYTSIDYTTHVPGNQNDFFGDIHEVGWKASYPLFAQGGDEIASNQFWLENDSYDTMSSSGCSLYSFVCMVHGIGLGREGIPRHAGSTLNGLNNKGLLDPEQVRQLYVQEKLTLSIDEADVRDAFGYDIKELLFAEGGPPDKYDEMWNDLRAGIPYAAVVNSTVVEGDSYWGKAHSEQLTNDGHYIVLLNGTVRNGTRYVEIADCNGWQPEKLNNYTWYDYDKMKATRALKRYAYTIVNTSGQGDFIVDLSKRIFQNGQLVLPEDKLIVSVVDEGGEQHLRVCKESYVFLDITGATIDSAILSAGRPLPYDKGTVIGTATSPTMRKGVINQSAGASRIPTYKDLVELPDSVSVD